jgi:hydroxylamine reductase (hybrid-cluster protein)
MVAFPEFYRTSTWATAVSFLALGCAVQIGVRLPFWGSPALSDILMRDWPLISGGTLLASPTLPNSQAQAQELISFLDGRKF